MHEENEIRINIPCDADGYLLLRCERCGEFFKLKPSDIEDLTIEIPDLATQKKIAGML